MENPQKMLDSLTRMESACPQIKFLHIYFKIYTAEVLKNHILRRYQIFKFLNKNCYQTVAKGFNNQHSGPAVVLQGLNDVSPAGWYAALCCIHSGM